MKKIKYDVPLSGFPPYYWRHFENGQKQLRFAPHEGQQEIIDFLNDPASEELYASWAAQTGKSMIIPWIIWQELKIQGNGRVLVIAPDSKMIYAGLQKPFLKIFRDELKITDKITRNSEAISTVTLNRRATDIIAQKSGTEPASTEIVFRHLKTDGSIPGHQAILVIGDELAAKNITQNVFDEVDDRLSIARAAGRGKAYYFSTPLHLGEFTQRFELYKGNYDPLVTTTNIPRWVNPSQKSKEHYETVVKPKRSKHEYERRVLGLPTKSEGAVFDQFTEHSIFRLDKELMKRKDLVRVAGYDTGSTNFGAVLGLYDKATDVLYIVDEYRYNRHVLGNLPTHITAHTKIFKKWNVAKACTGRAQSDIESIPFMRNAQIDTTISNIKEVSTYINEINRRFGENKLYISGHLAKLIRDLNMIAYEDSGKVNFQPFHVLDSLRYLCGLLFNPYWTAPNTEQKKGFKIPTQKGKRTRSGRKDRRVIRR